MVPGMSWNVFDELRQRRGLVATVAAALIVGIGAGYWLSRGGGPAGGKSDQPIEWHQVQNVPTRAPDAEDKQWQGRADALDAPETPTGTTTEQNVAENAEQ